MSMLFRNPDIYPVLHYDLGNSGVIATCLMSKGFYSILYP